MHNKIKNKFILLILAGGIIASGGVSAMEADYSGSDKTVTVSGNNAVANLAVVIMPYKYSADTLTADVINSTPNILYKPIAAGGAYSEIIPLAGDMITDGKYRVSENIKNKSADSVYFILSETDCNNIGTASGETEFKTRFNNTIATAVPEMNSDVKNALANKMYNIVKTSGYAYQSFLDNLALYEGILNCKYGVIDFGTYMEEYSPYISADLKTQYEALNETVKNTADGCITGIDVTSKDADEIISEGILVAKLRSALNSTELKQYATEYFNKNANTPSSYANLSDYYKNNVFATLFDERGTIANADDLTTRVSNIASNQRVTPPAPTGGGGGGGGSSDRSPVSGAPVGTTVTGEKVEVFNDISTHWAKENITEMHKLEIINGFDDGSFRPDKNVTRAEFVKMLVNALNYGTSGECSFADVPVNAWHYGYISSAVEKGVVSGISQSEFGPDMNITRQDAAVMVYRAINGGDGTDMYTSYNDMHEVSDYAYEAVGGLSASGMLTGSDGYFRPKNSITRAEAATLLLRVRKSASGGEQ